MTKEEASGKKVRDEENHDGVVVVVVWRGKG